MDIWSLLASALPVTALVAICLFVFKESVEVFRRRRAEKRKVGAIKRMVARDLELNQWAVNSFRHAVGALERIEAEKGRRGRIYESVAKLMHYEHWIDGEAHRSGGVLPPVVSGSVDRLLMDAATLDQGLLAHIERATTALANLNHIRVGVIEHIDDDMWRGGFIDFAKRELDLIEGELQQVHLYCAGTAKITPRLR